MPRLRRWGCGAGLAAVVAVVSGCAGVPVSGRVHIAGAPPAVSSLNGLNVRRFPSGPTSGMTRTELVSGFLNALVDSDNNFGIARSYLAPGTAWNSTLNTTLYDQNSVVTTRDNPHQVDVSVQRAGVIDSRGDFRAAAAPLDVRFGLVRHNGQWRISHLPGGVLLSTSDAQRSLQPVAIYYLNQAQTRLVPEPVLVPPDQPSLATTLITRLLAGPSRVLAPAVATAVPPGTSLAGNVPIDTNGVAQIDLSGAVQPLKPNQLARLSAQIVWTLRQLSNVTAVELLSNGAPLSSAGVPSVQQIGAWPQFDPAARPTSRGALLSDRGHTLGLRRSVPSPLLQDELFAPVVNADGALVAALRRSRGRSALLVGPTNGPLRTRLTGATLSAPQFDPAGDVVVVRGKGSRSAVIEVPRAGRAREVDVSPEIRRLGISQVAVSRDGARIAMLVGTPGHQALVVGAVSVTRRALVINGGDVVIPASQDVRGLAWAGADEIVTTVRDTADRRSVVETTVNGYNVHTVTSTGLPTDPTQVAAAPGQPVLAAAGGGVWSLADRRWTRVSTGGDPSYAG